MSLFLEPLHNERDDTLLAHLLTLYNAYHELGIYCAFLQLAYEGIVAQAELDPTIFDGVSMSSRGLVTRAQEIEQRFTEVLEIARLQQSKVTQLQ